MSTKSDCFQINQYFIATQGYLEISKSLRNSPNEFMNKFLRLFKEIKKKRKLKFCEVFEVWQVIIRLVSVRRMLYWCVAQQRLACLAAPH